MWLGLIILVALMIPVVGILVDSPIGRALANRLGGEVQTPPDLAALVRKVDLLEGDVDDLSRAVELLREENQFLQRLLEDQPP
ncbi:MAG: hypothetical protein SGI84_14690, partial [Gemmatimonadota bacterium]|nr:hypothetical protein [Gemmatimonadota bacterium]